MISVLMTSYNAEEYIADAVKSILAQTESDFECVVIDDGSTDDTIRIVEKFSDSRIRLIEAGRIGLARALNLGMRESRGEFIARHDADDLSHPRRFEIQKAAMQRFPDYSAVVSPPVRLSCGRRSTLARIRFGGKKALAEGCSKGTHAF